MSTVHESSPAAQAKDAKALSVLPEGRPFRLTAETFNKMIEADLFAREDRVGLWDGQIYEKMPRDQIHYMLPTFVQYALFPRLPRSWFPSGENLIQLGDHHLPLVDQSVIRGVSDRYCDHWPHPDEVGLLLEWSHCSLDINLSAKLEVYARAGVPAYCVLDLAKNLIQTYEMPIPAERRYAEEAIYAVGQAVPLRRDGVLIAEIPTLDLLPVRG